jgi:hypothetical protein
MRGVSHAPGIGARRTPPWAATYATTAASRTLQRSGRSGIVSSADPSDARSYHRAAVGPAPPAVHCAR